METAIISGTELSCCKCPYCGHVHPISGEDLIIEGIDVKMCCEDCGNMFYLN